ncbi:MAG: hypothetical protein KBD26_01765 [Candidatus Pacebacteria bacterium]|nr:hypothetical protein [Candidatus Paceibacterota bacterium]MBP9772538.1 hypothetical protein [Candidatus Paceibacterota bacterium]
MKKFLKTLALAILIIIIALVVIAEYGARNNSHGLCGIRQSEYRNIITKETRATSSNCKRPFPAILWNNVTNITY